MPPSNCYMLISLTIITQKLKRAETGKQGKPETGNIQNVNREIPDHRNRQNKPIRIILDIDGRHISRGIVLLCDRMARSGPCDVFRIDGMAASPTNKKQKPGYTPQVVPQGWVKKHIPFYYFLRAALPTGRHYPRKNRTVIRFRELEKPRMAGSRREEHGAIRCPQGRHIQKKREASRYLVADIHIYATGDFRNERSRPCIPRSVFHSNRETRSHFCRSF